MTVVLEDVSLRTGRDPVPDT